MKTVTINNEVNTILENARIQIDKFSAKLPMLGHVVWLMMQQAGTKHTVLSQLELQIIPPLVLGQSKIFLKNGLPVAFISWAKLSEEVEARYMQQPHQLIPTDWNSGDRVWIVDLYAPYGGLDELKKQMKENEFLNQSVFLLSPSTIGQGQKVQW